jgi:hypothetical protein
MLKLLHAFSMFSKGDGTPLDCVVDVKFSTEVIFSPIVIIKELNNLRRLSNIGKRKNRTDKLHSSIIWLGSGDVVLVSFPNIHVGITISVGLIATSRHFFMCNG